MAPSAKNPNGPSRLQSVANARKARSQQARVEALASNKNRIAKQDARRGARPGILPTSGPNTALSRKKAKKIERALGHAQRRQQQQEAQAAAAEEEKEVDDQVTEADAAQTKKAKKNSRTDGSMEVDE
ncbi:hypothetical protein F5X68DRAFT_227016 [Plectosphaerella plurivora]|uniref:Uncharacterized protein n=1 Tax=Plectosphaerella plurivora TaxID=936078 RepID=A0A9P8VIN4_9PEZI|nr:hypothetical protein F5X68DRAFT_227016 [Plectosphaerella plurivora]